MTRPRLVAACILVLAAVSGLSAASAAGQERSAVDDLGHVFSDGWAVLSAPATAAGGDLRTAMGLAAGGAALVLVDRAAREWVRENQGSIAMRAVGAFREEGALERLGRTAVLASLSLASWGAGLASDSPALRDAGMGCVTANVSYLVARRALSFVLARARPAEERGPLAFEPLTAGGWPMRSLPGGHAGNPMSCASFLAHRFDLGSASAAAYAVPAAMGLARMADDAHWLSDTYVALVLGYAVGRTVAGRVERRGARRSEAAGPALVLTWRLFP